MTKKVKGIFLGGNFSYRITKDKKYFIKTCKGGREWILKEYENLKNYWNKLNIEDLQLVEPIDYSEEKESLITRYVDGKSLKDILNPKLYYIFGKKLKKFHDKGFIHGHIDLTDILYTNGKFVLVDVPFFNERTTMHDLVTIKISLNMHILKKPWKFFKYRNCEKELLRGYNLENYSEYKRKYKELMKSRTNLLLRKGFFLKGMILKMLLLMKLI
ncbi:MAG: hypothetical protein ACFFHV_11845 [Promethearchaeota archaeon]